MLRTCGIRCCVEGEKGGGPVTLDVAWNMLATWPLNIFYIEKFILNVAKTYFYVANILWDVAKCPVGNVPIGRLGASTSVFNTYFVWACKVDFIFFGNYPTMVEFRKAKKATQCGNRRHG
jgi:type IV secretory pathway VirB6-like protein